MIKYLLPICFPLLLFTSCFSSKKTIEAMNVWLGETKQKLMMSYGPPDNVSDDGAGGEILVYKTFYTPVATGIDQTTTCRSKMYFINSTGVVYHCLSKLESVPPSQVNVSVIRTP